VALLNSTFNAGILAIDRVPVSGSSWTLMPGPHEILVRFRAYTTAPNMEWKIWSYCRVELRAVAGEEYETLVRIRKKIAPGLSEEVTLEMGIADREGVLRGAPRSCSSQRPELGS
jgi:hypothetical protein